MPDTTSLADRRRALRYDTTIKAVIRTSQGARHAVVLNDLSEGGCAVTASGHPLAPGVSYGLKINGLETLGSVAAWANGQSAGLEFQHALHPAVADYLVRLHPPVEEEPDHA